MNYQKVINSIESNKTNRYQIKENDKEDYLLQSEIKLAKYLNKKYCLGVNSGASAIFLGLMSLIPNLRNRIVYSNSFTFSAVPSAIVHANLDIILVETTRNLVIDIEDFRDKIKKYKGSCLVLSYMRGFIPDLDKIVKLCQENDIYLIEDAAHAYGVKYNNKLIGNFGEIATISTQSNKIINSGEGGFILTDNPDIMSFCMVASGCYEQFYLKHHLLSPPIESINKYLNHVPNYSMRLSNIQGALILEQIDGIEKLIEQINENHNQICQNLKDCSKIEVIKQNINIRPTYDSIQFRLNMSLDKSKEFIKIINTKYKIERFLEPNNARNYKSWKFLDHIQNLEKTNISLINVFDMRLSHNMSRSKIDEFTTDILNAIDCI